VIAIPAVTVPKNALSLGAGYLFWAQLGTAEPGWTIAGSVFTDAWTGWSLLGVTREGHELTYEISTDTIEAAEYLDPLMYVTTGRTAGMSFDMMQVHATNFRRALNAGSPTTTGSGTTLRTTVRPPAIGAEIRVQLGWESTANDERLIALQCFQTGNITVQRKKGADNASIPVEYRFEIDSNGDPFRYETAGTLRG
jgi:hypothetical protein